MRTHPVVNANNEEKKEEGQGVGETNAERFTSARCHDCRAAWFLKQWSGALRHSLRDPVEAVREKAPCFPQAVSP